MQLVCFPFDFDAKENDPAIDCIVLPPIDLFLNLMTKEEKETKDEDYKQEFSVVNWYLLALILLWTKPECGIYHSALACRREKMQKSDTTKKSLLVEHVHTKTEELKKDNEELEKKLEKERQQSEKERQKLMLQIEELLKNQEPGEPSEGGPVKRPKLR